MKIYSAYDRPPKVLLVCEDPSLARESEKDATDVNKIMERYKKTGIIPMSGQEMFFADVSSVASYQEIMDRVAAGNQAFERLPAEVRARYQNDPAVFLDALQDKAARAQLELEGLIETPEKASAEASDAPQGTNETPGGS